MFDRRRIAVVVFMLSAALPFAGCGPGISTLKKDSLDDDRGLMIVRLRIKDTTRKLIKDAPLVNVSREDGRDFLDIYADPDESRRGGKRRRGNYYWDERDDANYFDQLFFITAKPGRYLLNAGIMQTARYHIPLNIGCDVRSGEAVVTGAVNIVIDSMKGKFAYYEIIYRTDWVRDAGATGSILEGFKATYPELYKKFTARGAAGKAYYAYYDKFKDEEFIPSDNPSDRTRERRWDAIDIRDSGQFGAIMYKSYKLSANYDDKNAYGYAGKKDRLNLPGNYTINYAIRWMEGMKDVFYGLRLAQDDKNAYYFGVSADRRPAIWIKKDGAWQAKPQVKGTSTLHASSKIADDFSVEMRNNQITYTINGEPVGSIAGVLELGSAYAGFFVSGKQKVEVDLFKIVEKQ